MELISSLLYTVIVGGVFIFLFIYAYDLLYGEKREKQIHKINRYFRKEKIISVDILEHQPKKYTLFQVKTDKDTKRVKLKPGYKIVKMVPKKHNK